jgi:hypothetical protein
VWIVFFYYFVYSVSFLYSSESTEITAFYANSLKPFAVKGFRELAFTFFIATNMLFLSNPLFKRVLKKIKNEKVNKNILLHTKT